MAWRQVKVEDQREYLVKSYLSNLAPMNELCNECEVSPKTGYKWVKRYREGGTQALSDQSRAPKKPHKKYSKKDIQIALELKRRYPKYGPKKIVAMLAAKYPDRDWPSATRLYEVFKEHHLVCSRKLRRRVPRTHPLSHANQSNDVWCADFKGWFKTKDKTKVEPFTVTDGYSRYVICCQHLDRKTWEDVWRVYSELFINYGLPVRIRTDNGPPFASVGVGRLSLLSVNLIKAGVMPEWINPGCPQENGRHERFHRSLKENTASPPAETLHEQVFRMESFVEEYNFDRPHEALNFQVPGSIYSPSKRSWDGKLRSPEYDTNQFSVRKVGDSNLCFHWKGTAIYLGKALKREYVGVRQVGDRLYDVVYGPVYLGSFEEGKVLELPKLQLRKR